MEIFNKIENLDTKKLFLISLISCICFALARITLLILSFNVSALFLLLIYLTIKVLIVVFIKQEKSNIAFLLFICSVLLDVLFNFVGFWDSARKFVDFILMLALLGVLILYFYKGNKDLKLAYLIIGIHAYISVYTIVDNFYWLFKFDKYFYYNIIYIILYFSTLLYYFMMIAIINKPRGENDAELLVKFLKVFAIVVVVFLCITIIKSCIANSDSGEKCKYIDEYGNESCYRTATKGNLCKEHFDETMGFYNDLEDWWNSLS